VPSRDLQYRIHVCRLAEGVDGQDSTRVGRNRIFDAVRIHVQRIRLDVHEHGTRTLIENAIGRGNETEGRRDNLVSLSYASGPNTQVQTSSTAADANGMLPPDVACHLALEALDHWAHAQPRREKHLIDKSDFLIADIRP